MNMIKKTLASISALFLFVNLNGCQMLDSVNAMIDNTNDIANNVEKLASIGSSQSANEPEENLPDVDGLKYVSYKKLCEDSIKSSSYASDTYVDKYYTKIDNAEFSGSNLFFFNYNYDKDSKIYVTLALFRSNELLQNALSKKDKQFLNQQKDYLKKLSDEKVKLNINEKMIVSTGVVPIRIISTRHHPTATYEYFTCNINTSSH